MSSEPQSPPDAAVFDAERPRLFGLAYRMLGSVADAEDIVQEAWIRFAGAASIDNPAAFLTTVVSRLAIDRLRSAQVRRETYVGPWLAEPVLTDRDPAHIVEVDETVSLGFLHALDRLEPVERAVFLLHEVFGCSYGEVASTVGRSEVTCRQIASRARRRVRAERPRVVVESERKQQLLDGFLAAVFSGDLDELEAMLAEDVVLVSDGGPNRRAARNRVIGPRRVARLLRNLALRTQAGSMVEPIEINGQLALAIVLDGVPVMINVFEFVDDRVWRIQSVLSGDKLASARRAYVAASGDDPDSNPAVADPPALVSRRPLDLPTDLR